ncbi:MAG: NCS2 family permease [Acidobacteria bacterium]|nr:NCS2 family permease [Acidobacteriota bacterium]
MRSGLERYFEFSRLGTNWRTEILAGVTTFVTMAYIIFVNPSILSQTGMPAAGVMAATCISAGIASILMGAVARYPIALAPGMGLNAYFTYAVVKGMGVPWQVALGAVFLSGVAFLLLTVAGVREKLIRALPVDLYGAVAAGIGLFIAFIGLRNAGIIMADPATAVKLGDLKNPSALVALAGLVITAALQARQFPLAILTGIAASTGIALVTGVARWNPQWGNLGELGSTFLQLDIAGAMNLGLAEILFVFLFVDLFDNLGTLVGVTKHAGLMPESGELPRVNRVLMADASATMLGALTGTSTVVSYIESTAGIVAGGRSGVTAIVTGLLFLVSLVAAPLVGVVPAAATAPALVLVGAAMMSHTAEVRWGDPLDAIPAFLTIAAIPLTFSIANGLALGFVSFALLRLLSGRGREVSWIVWVLVAAFVARFVLS